MITIDEKDYNLNFLIHFDMLKEILIKLSKNQSELLRDVSSIKESNKTRDYKIMKIENSLKGQETQYEELEQKNASIEKNEEKKEKREFDSLINNTSSNEEEKKEKKDEDSQNMNNEEEDKKEENIKA